MESAKSDTKELLSPHPDTQWKRAWCQTSCIFMFYYSAKDLRYELRARGSLGVLVLPRQPHHPAHTLQIISTTRRVGATGERAFENLCIGHLGSAISAD